METTSAEQLFELFWQTLDCCGLFLLNCEPRDIEYYLFEEFDSDSITILHENTLNRLFDEAYISVEAYPLCQLLRKKFRELEGTSLWNVEAVRTAPEWYAILSLSDRIKGMLKG